MGSRYRHKIIRHIIGKPDFCRLLSQGFSRKLEKPREDDFRKRTTESLLGNKLAEQPKEPDRV